MRTVTKPVLTFISIVLMLSMFLSGCAPAATTAPTEAVAVEPTAVPEEPTAVPEEPTAVPEEPTAVPEEPTAAPVAPVATLKIWADDTRTPILQAFADDFLAKYNVELIVEDLGVVQDIRTPMITAAPAGEGPDIFIGVHDWLGALVESGLVAPIDLGDKADEFVGSCSWMLSPIPMANCTVYPTPPRTWVSSTTPTWSLHHPTTWDEVLEIGRPCKAEGKVQYAIAMAAIRVTTPCRSRPPLVVMSLARTRMAPGMPDDVGLDSEGMIAAVTWMKACC